MKKLFLFLASIAVLCSCSSDEVFEESNPGLRSFQSSKGLVIITFGLEYTKANNQFPACYMNIYKHGWVSGKDRFYLDVGYIICNSDDWRVNDFAISSHPNYKVPYNGYPPVDVMVDLMTYPDWMESVSYPFNLEEEYTAVYATDFWMLDFFLVFEDANGNKLGSLSLNHLNKVVDNDVLNLDDPSNNYAAFSTPYNDYYFHVENPVLFNHNRDYGFEWLN